jgi:hypothetical protein
MKKWNPEINHLDLVIKDKYRLSFLVYLIHPILELELMMKSIYDINKYSNSEFLKKLSGDTDIDLNLTNSYFIKLGKSQSFFILPDPTEHLSRYIYDTMKPEYRILDLSKNDSNKQSILDINIISLCFRYLKSNNYLIISNLKGTKGLWNNLDNQSYISLYDLKNNKSLEKIYKELATRDDNKKSEGSEVLKLLINKLDYRILNRVILINDDKYEDWKSRYEDAI